MESIIGLVIGTLIGAVISGAIIWLVSKLNIGLSVDSFGWAMATGVFIGMLTNGFNQLFTGMNEVITMVVHLLISAGAILLAGKAFNGVNVKGFKGALVAAVAIAVVGFGLVLLLAGIIGGAASAAG